MKWTKEAKQLLHQHIEELRNDPKEKVRKERKK